MQNCVIDVPGLLMPGIEDHLFIGVVGMHRGHDSFDRVVKEDGADSRTCIAELELMSLWQLAEKRLVLADRLAFVVEDGPAAADPARINDWPFVHDRARLGLDLLLNLATKAVRVAEGDLDLGLLIPQLDR